MKIKVGDMVWFRDERDAPKVYGYVHAINGNLVDVVVGKYIHQVHIADVRK